MANGRKAVSVGATYRHFKGNEYIVLCLARDSETLEDVVVYRDCGDESKIWVRPLSMFLEQVQVNGQWVARFARCGRG